MSSPEAVPLAVSQAVSRGPLDPRSHDFVTAAGRYRIRPAQPEDRAALRQMIEHEPPEDLRLRFFRAVHGASDALLDPMLRDDDIRHAALVAMSDDPPELVASAMLVTPKGSDAGEFGILVARPHAERRLGSHLLECLVHEARARGLRTIYGVILAENAGMIDLARRLGFSIQRSEEPGCVKAVRPV